MRLIARTTGFYQGARVRAGESFEFSGGAIPGWASTESQPVVAKQISGDTKPRAARAAARRKAQGPVVYDDDLIV